MYVNKSIEGCPTNKQDAEVGRPVIDPVGVGLFTRSPRTHNFFDMGIDYALYVLSVRWLNPLPRPSPRPQIPKRRLHHRVPARRRQGGGVRSDYEEIYRGRSPRRSKPQVIPPSLFMLRGSDRFIWWPHEDILRRHHLAHPDQHLPTVCGD